MSSSPAKHKSSYHHHHHHHHHHREHQHHSSSASGTLTKPLTNLSFIKTADQSRLLPKYSAAVAKPQDDCLPMDEIDGIQMDLEVLLSSVSLRYRALKAEFDYLEDRKHQRKNANKDKESSPSTSKRKRDDKKSKDSSRHSHTKHSKNKSGSLNSPAHSQPLDVDVVASSNIDATQTNPKLQFPKNDIPNKFWFSVEPYCMPITQEDIKLLDELLDDYVEPLVPPIPELGTNFTIRWASDDIRANDATKKNGEKMLDQGVCGQLTQRLVSGLFEENSNIQSDLDIQDSSDSCTENNPSSANRVASIASMLKSGIDVEKRLKKELLELGILEPEFGKEKEDEVLNEIKRVRTELHAIAEFNRDELKQLKAVAKDEIKRLEIKQKLDRVDQEIIEAHKRVLASKQKRRPLTKNERNEILRLADEQRRLSDQLEAMPFPGFNFANFNVGAADATNNSTASNSSKA